MPEVRKKFVSVGSVTLKVRLEPRLETRKLADELGKGTDTVSRWATGERQPTPPDRATLEDRLGIQWRSWDDFLDDEAADELAEKLREAAAEPTTTFPSDAPPAAGGAGHAA